MTAPKILVVIPDLMFQSRVCEQAGALGYKVEIADREEAAAAGIHASPDLLVLDLNAAGIGAGQVIEAAKEKDIPILAFGRHTETDVLRAAREAGCDRVVVRSTFVEELPQLLRELAGPRAPADPR